MSVDAMDVRVVNLSRRRFLTASGGSLLLGVALPIRVDAAGTPAAPTQLGPWIRIDADGTVTLYAPDCEMGQGVYTGLPLILAEELDCDFDRVRIEVSSADKAYDNPRKGYIATGGSLAVRGYFDLLRKTGATARAMLLMAAARQWNSEAAGLRTDAGFVIGDAPARRASYGELAARAAELEVPEDVALKRPGDFRLIGTNVPRKDTPAKVDGSAVFGIDVQRPGMLHAAVRQAPVFGGRVASFDQASVAGLPGVHGVHPIDNGVAVLASTWWQAKSALEQLDVTFDAGPNGGADTESIRARTRAALDEVGLEARADGDVASALAAATKRVEAVYEVPYLAHVCMEPMTCTAELANGELHLWAPTQAATGSRAIGAQMTGLPAEKVHVHRTFLGGGFGRRWQSDFLRQAIALTQASGRPVKVTWSREEDLRHDFYRPGVAVRYRAGLDEGGAVSAVDCRIAAPSILDAIRPGARKGPDPTATSGVLDDDAALGAVRIEYCAVDSPMPVGFWRSVGHSHNGFFKESFVDELAHAAGEDPYRFRRRLLAGSRQLAALDAAAEAAGWNEPVRKGRGRGIAVVAAYDSVVAQVIEVAVRESKLSIERVVAAVDCGLVLEPRNVEAQIMSAIVDGLSAALTGKVTLRNGAVVESNFHDYPLLGLARTPRIEIVLLRSDAPPGGIGEAGLPPVAAALCNAIHAATAQRLRRLPVLEHGFELV
jgi:isoquinoline 1-oxidoreductase beta subunit